MFEPNVGDEILIGGYSRFITAHPTAGAMLTPYGQEGRAGTVYQLRDSAGGLTAFKVFNPGFRHPSLVEQVGQLRRFGELPGLSVCHRAVMTPEQQGPLLQQYPELAYAVLMPWIEGRPWNQIIQDRRPLTHHQSQALAEALRTVLAYMDREGVAHGDLSGANLMIDGLDTGDIRIELVDVEQLYAPGLTRPAKVPAGSPGYAHATIAGRPWQADTDRFAGAILLAEILGWCDERVRAAADSITTNDGKIIPGESYFAEDELQQDCERYRLLCSVLTENWGADAAALLQRAWNSPALAECPSFSADQAKQLPPPPPSPRQKARTDLVANATAAEQNGRWGQAVVFYDRLLTGWPGDPATDQWMTARDLARQKAEPPPKPVPPRRIGWRWAAPALALLLILFGGGAALAGLWPFGGGSEPAPTATMIAAVATESLPTATPGAETAVPPADSDTDGDGLSDSQETQNYNTDPNNADSDGDGLSDGQETQNYNTDPRSADSDGDGLSDGQEVQNYNTDPRSADSDGDGLSDGQEVQNYSTDPNNADSDGDGLSDGQEAQNYSTDPRNPDSDGDGQSDGQEVKTHNTDPNNANSGGSQSGPGGNVAVVEPQKSEPQEKSRITGFQLINPTTGRAIGAIEDGDTISLRQSGCGTSGACYLNVEAIVDGADVASVTFMFDGKPIDINGRSLENTAPYYMAGDINGDPQGNWNWARYVGGQHTIEAQPCDRDNGEEPCTLPLTVTFTVTR